MTSIKLSESDPTVLTFDGNVLEVFYISSYRIHITSVGKIELKTDKKGKHSIVIRDTDRLRYNDEFSVDENVLPKVTNLIAEIERAKAAFQFD